MGVPKDPGDGRQKVLPHLQSGVTTSVLPNADLHADNPVIRAD